MLKAALVFLAFLSLSAAAHAQPTPDAAALADVQPPAAASQAKGATTVPDLVVNGERLPHGKCPPKDKACVIAVAKAVWDQYPEQTRMYCSQEKMRALAKREDLKSFFSGNAVPVNMDSDYMPPALEVVCAYGDRKARDAMASAGKSVAETAP